MQTIIGPHKLWKCNLQRCNAFLVGVGVSALHTNRKLITEQAHFLLFVRSRSTNNTTVHIYNIIL